MQTGQVHAVLDFADGVADFAAQRQRSLEQLPRALAFAVGAATAAKLRIELARLRRQLRLFAARRRQLRQHQVDALARVAKLAQHLAAQGQRFQQQAQRDRAGAGDDRGLAVEQRLGLAVVAQADAAARDHAEQFRARARLACQLAIAALDGGVEQAAKVERLPLGANRPRWRTGRP